ncbi:hypothetical protein CVT26_007598 [Gymnopilus dilepis]|uniref:Uncharacterized protein n=1 Tax=Gymnopilus dilepis TaxID=231916 RepID=A0A409VZR1_9AGAR|nr:hypothetical protein CVT26_007598 [Gymnopilus dilepis]
MSSPPLSVETHQSSASAQPSPSDSTPPTTDNNDQPQKAPASPRPMRKYTRQQLVSLSNSPLVKPPPNMPDLKVWFGSENENLVKKDEPTTPNTTRDRRFRRDAEDGADLPARPTFRTALTQPSQMGNFKHQSLRASDRDRDREREREGDKERDRDKDGHERLRHAKLIMLICYPQLSDKFDRDRLALPLSGGRKERDAAPHLNSSSSRSSQTLSSNAASRRAEGREAAKKKVGAEPPRSSRDDRSENSRREDRERARSRARDSSRAKREASVSQRDREDAREKPSRGDRDRDDHRRDKDDSRRDRENDTEDDPRHWRDDGKRDERLAARRDRERARDKDNNWESADKRWGTGDDREGRYKRAGRDRKGGNATEEAKEKEDRREKEREKEKEPAWMDAYIPSENMSGILGGQDPNGGLDGIQAWKKGMKEKESKEKEASGQTVAKNSTPDKSSLPTSSGNLDEIQMFKLMMKQEEEKRKTETVVNTSQTGELKSTSGKSETPPESTQPIVRDIDNGPVQPLPRNTLSPSVENPSSQDPSAAFSFSMKDLGKALPTAEPPAEQGLLPLAGAPDSTQRLASKQSTDFDAGFQPPPGSRLLAFARGPSAKTGNGNAPQNTSQVLNGALPNIGTALPPFSKNEPPRPPSAFSPFEDPARQLYGLEEPRNSNLPLNVQSRTVIEQTISASITAQAEPNFNGAGSRSGSRFAKFFDGKAREGPPQAGRPSVSGGFTSPSPSQLQRQEQVSLVTANTNDHRAMEELFAMLNNSSQRNNPGHGPPSNPNPLLNNTQAFGTPGPGLHALQHQHILQQQQQHHNHRLEPLYDSRADDRNFVPDGMVPGLRPMPPPPARGREGPFIDQLEEPLPYNFQRIPHQPQQHIRNVEPLYPQSGPAPLFAQHSGRSSGGLNMPSLQQPQVRGGPSPNINQGSPVSNVQQQRLPPGLANLGGRPPHEPSQFIGLPGMPSNLPHNALHGNGPLGPQQLPFNNFNGANNMGFNNNQIRGPMPGPNLPHTNPQHPLGGLGPNVDPRLPNPHHLMGLGGSGNNGTRANGGFHQGPTNPAHLGMRPQQQQAHLPPHMLPHHLIPPHLQQQGHPTSNNPPAHDLMALLMGGSQRE